MTRKAFRAQTLSSNTINLRANAQYVALRADNAVTSNLIFTLPNNYGTAGQAVTTDGSGRLLFSSISGGGSNSTLSVGTTSSSNVITNAVNGVSTIAFDLDSGFDVVDLGNDTVKIQINSTFKFWEVEGQDTIVAEGLDTVTFIAGDNISLATNATSKSLTISAAGGAGGNTTPSNAISDFFTVGSSNSFTLSQTVDDANNIIVALGGLIQYPSVDYSVTGSTLNLSNTAPIDPQLELEVRHLSVVSAASSGGSTYVDTWETVNSNAYTVPNTKYFVDTSNSAIDLYLPNTASYGSYVRVIDAVGNSSINTLTIKRNGHRIQGADSDMTVTVDRAAFGLTYFNASQGWLLTER